MNGESLSLGGAGSVTGFSDVAIEGGAIHPQRPSDAGVRQIAVTRDELPCGFRRREATVLSELRHRQPLALTDGCAEMFQDRHQATACG
jgi:hypothetical protein